MEDVQELKADEVRVGRSTTNPRENGLSLFFTTLVDEPPEEVVSDEGYRKCNSNIPGGEWHEEDTDTEDDSGAKLEGDGDTPRSFALC